LPDNMKYQQAVIFTPELNCGTVLWKTGKNLKTHIFLCVVNESVLLLHEKSVFFLP
jgi:hypothetical protein